MTLSFVLLFFCYSFVRGAIPSNSTSFVPIISNNTLSPSQEYRINAEVPQPTKANSASSIVAGETDFELPASTPPVASSSEAIYISSEIQPAQSQCASQCAVALPDITVYKWQSVQITATKTVETVTLVVNPQFWPNVTGTVRHFDYGANDEEVARNRFAVNKAGVVITSLEAGATSITVAYPTPVTITPTTMTLIGGPPAITEAPGAPCTSGGAAQVNLTTIANAQIYSFGSPESPLSSGANKAAADTVHWRLVPERYQHVDPMEFTKLFPPIPAMGVCGVFGQPDKTASITQISAIEYLTTTTTSTVSGSKYPGIAPNILLTKKPASTLDGPGDKDGGIMQVHKETSATPKPAPVSAPASGAGIAMPMITGLTAQLDGPGPRQQQSQQAQPSAIASSIAAGVLGPALGMSNPGASSGIGSSQGHVDHPGGHESTPLVINGHVFTSTGKGSWIADDGQVLEANGAPIEVTVGSHGEHKMNVALKSAPEGRQVLVVDGASMTLSTDMPAATGSSSSRGGRSKGGLGGSSGSPGHGDDGIDGMIDPLYATHEQSSGSSSDSSSDLPLGSSPKSKQPEVYTGGASVTSLNMVSSCIAGFAALLMLL
ncbi:hypothetical protein BT63DRAFT_415657 [Microthyrium microscopicum]|uniref:BIG2 domain-containing protein n=1 Tax=Microthyrium microscopicum TaxID=703497 RepID=A0A6A6U325_9PEZI|nr:hypothetical protein BT63DRAFT_415657 [Microthyrium microscopicum]